ncbi:hypothetical protein Asppvi_009844 [Aspergillus pseudoviridinutans]|uniref:Uncharacterized protein n=1 Tax=Aspergillus pseudoviridinutans TaxID=1517512 RepID=A0A9P3EWJ1_9EURO|nr:uncharacterized protein Asppvi_009844 [Aspergillus pseudoviridinutans]GIJ90879.1 hypothetical protein Asppvi_009844 [Aspergillus pseudoviridinutans]
MASATATGMAPISGACTGPEQYELPVNDAACGVPNTDSYRSVFDRCAEPAGVRPYYNDCALYALAVDQSVQDLINCLYNAGIEWEDVWCYGETNATATAISYPKPTGHSATSNSTSTTRKSSVSSTSPPRATAADENSAMRFTKSTFGVKSSLALLCLVVSAFVV